MKKIILLIFCFSISSCGLIFLKSTNAKNTRNGQYDIAPPKNANNVIYKTNRSFVYDVDQVQKNRHLRFQLELSIIPVASNWEESIVKYKYTYNATDLTQQELLDWRLENGSFLPEYTSVTKKANHIYLLQPPRTKTLECLKEAPFPEVLSGFTLGATGRSVRYIPRKNGGEMGGSKIKWKYSTDAVDYKQDTIPYFCGVPAEARLKNDEFNTLEMHFNVDSGFTKLTYNFEDLTSVKFVLKEIR